MTFLPDQNETDKQTKDKSKEIEGCSYGDEDRYEKKRSRQPRQTRRNKQPTFSCLESNCLFFFNNKTPTQTIQDLAKIR